jgi:phenylalanyl-tRNA synthetase beta chain
VTREIDLIEEVARHHGYERIVPTRRRSPYVGNLGALNALRRRLRRIANGLGAHEAWTSSIVDPELAVRVGSTTAVVELANPMVHEESVLRSGLLAGLLGALRYNAGHRANALRLFETGHVFAAASGDTLPIEREHVGMIFAGVGDDAAAALEAWATIADALRLDTAAVRLDQSSGEEGGGPLLAGELGVGIHPARAAVLWLTLPDGDAATALGALGEVDPDVLAAFSLPADRRVGWIVLDLEVLAAVPRRDVHAQPVSRFPSSDIDLAFVLDDSVPAARLEEVLRASAGELGESVRLLDVYRGPGLALGSRSLAYRIRFCALDRTLTDAEVATLRLACIEAVERELPARIRA